MNREQRIEFIQAIEDTKALERAILDIIDELKSEGSKEIATCEQRLLNIGCNFFRCFFISGFSPVAKKLIEPADSKGYMPWISNAG